MRKKRFQKISKSFEEKIRAKVKERFGFEFPAEWKFYSIEGKNFYFWPIHAFSGEDELVNFLRAKLVDVGLIVGNWENEMLRLSLEVSDFLPRECKNVNSLNAKEAEKWLRGENLQLSAPRGSYILEWKGRFLGGAWSNGKEIVNFLPKTLEFELKPTKKRERKEKN